ncbi:preprotein translocase subunit Sec61beta [Candidatus Woesearchaeota archaeon]|nr:preprotein translocase subunit Sec61beta [Candidatus Woesearchaeota archaeon]
MSRDNKISMPTSTAGITRFSDASKSKVSFKPEYVIVFVIVVALIIILLHLYGARWLGIA